ncbi:HD domain-containing protein [bacterium]|nr:HD domain-containing protein [bacterium]
MSDRKSGTQDSAGAEWATVAEFQVGKRFCSYLQFLSRERKTTAKGDPYYQCVFRDKTGRVEAKAWNSSDLFRWCQNWTPGDALWIEGTLSQRDPKYAATLEVHNFARIEDDPELAANFDWSLLVESSRWTPEVLKAKIDRLLEEYVKDLRLIRLVEILFEENWAVLSTLPAASRMHHAMQSGWLEHIWSMTRLAALVGKHYAAYYDDLNPPLRTDILILGAILHDIGKAVELTHDRKSEATYTSEGKLLGHIVMGRDMIREAAARLDPSLDDETLLRLEHAVLSHHGRTEFGSPVYPQTLESFLLAEIDDMDAKVNAIARALRTAQANSMNSTAPDAGIWTDRVHSCDPGRNFYRGRNPVTEATPDDRNTGEPSGMESPSAENLSDDPNS